MGRTVSLLQGVPAAAPSMGAAPVPPPMYVVEEPVAAAFVGASVGASVAWCLTCLGGGWPLGRCGWLLVDL